MGKESYKLKKTVKRLAAINFELMVRFRQFYDDYRNQRNIRDNRPNHEEDKPDWRARHDRNVEPRVTPGHKTYSQVVKDGRNSSEYTTAQSSKNFARDRYHTAPHLSERDRRNKQTSTRRDQPRDGHRRVFLKRNEQSRPRQKDEEPARTIPELTRPKAAGDDRNCYDTGLETKNSEGRHPSSSAERKTEEQSHDDHVSEHSSESDIDRPSSNEDEEEINSGIPVQDLPPVNTTKDHEKSFHAGKDKDLPVTAEADRQAKHPENEREEDRTEAATRPKGSNGSNHLRQSARDVDDVTHDESGAGDHSALDTADGQSETHGDQEAELRKNNTKRASRSTTKTKAQEKTPARMSTRAGASKDRSLSQGSIKEAFKKKAAAGGSQSKERDKSRVKEGIKSSQDPSDSKK